MAQSQRSPFAQILYDLMIVPEVLTIEQWAQYMNPYWTDRRRPGGMLFGLDGEPGPDDVRCCEIGIGLTAEKISWWFEDRVFPDIHDLERIRFRCGGSDLGRSWQYGGPDAADALKRFDAMIAAPAQFYSPLSGEFFHNMRRGHSHIPGRHMYDGVFENVISAIMKLPAAMWVETAHELQRLAEQKRQALGIPDPKWGDLADLRLSPK